jgi:hypothetical protein
VRIDPVADYLALLPSAKWSGLHQRRNGIHVLLHEKLAWLLAKELKLFFTEFAYDQERYRRQ